ncbi:hypothetical protein [Cohnella sp.]|uniref:hypothetical protein n=1 Tax=Cohnella sp. TaxID=1883426 RepID=UPI0035688B4A
MAVSREYEGSILLTNLHKPKRIRDVSSEGITENKKSWLERKKQKLKREKAKAKREKKQKLKERKKEK